MHNLHFVVVKSTDAQSACDEVEGQIFDFGDEDNWRTICGCVSEDNEVLDLDRGSFMAGRYLPTEMELTTIDLINDCVKNWLTVPVETKQIVEDIDNGIKKIKDLDDYDFKLLRDYIDTRYYGDLKANFNVLENEFNANCYDDIGVTQMASDYDGFEPLEDDDGFEPLEDDEPVKTFVVFVDMHS